MKSNAITNQMQSYEEEKCPLFDYSGVPVDKELEEVSLQKVLPPGCPAVAAAFCVAKHPLC